MKLTRLYLAVHAVLAAVAAFLTPIFRGAERTIDFVLDRLTIAADSLAPMSPHALAFDGVHLSPGREVRHLAHHSVHARAVPRSEQGDPGDPEDDDDGNDMRDNGLRKNMRC